MYPGEEFGQGDILEAGGSLLDIPGVAKAVEYVKAQVGAFFQLPQRLRAATEKSARLLSVASSKGRDLESAELVAVQKTIASLRSTYAETEKKVSWVLDQLKAAGFGALPLALVGVAIAVAGTMAYLFRATSFNESLLDKIEKKVLTPAEAAALFGKRPLLGLNLGGLFLPLALAGGAYAAYKFLGKKRAA